MMTSSTLGAQRQEVREMELKYPGTEFDPVRFSAEHPNHIPCVALNSEQHQGGRFQYQQDRGDAILLPEKAVHVTALAYSREFDALAVGFNFGTFQLWSLTAERMLYSSPIGEGGTCCDLPLHNRGAHHLFFSTMQAWRPRCRCLISCSNATRTLPT